jgi:hypothetical protein
MTKSIEDAVSYCPETGVFRWKVKNRGGILPGDIAGCFDKDGYWVLTWQYKRYQAHRVAWFLMTGQWPPDFIDHRNLNRSDNRWANLRPATRQQNNANRGNYGSLSKGVSHAKNGRYRAQIQVSGRKRTIGIFDTEAEAHAAYVAEAEKHFGEFARAA